MARYIAFLRGVSPMNAQMAQLKRAFERAGFDDVSTVLASGNVIFGCATAATTAIERRAEQAMSEHLDRTFTTFVRPAAALRRLLANDPFARFDPPAGAKRVVTFLRNKPSPPPALPIERDGACIAAVVGQEAFTFYLPRPGDPVFMALIEKTFGAQGTTRTWDTVTKCVAAAGRG